MRKALRIIAVASGIISVVSTVVLGFIYLEDILKYIKKTKAKLTPSESAYEDDEFKDFKLD